MRRFIPLFLALWLLPSEILSQAVTVKSPGEAQEDLKGKNLTDEERHKSQTFVNEALGNKIVREECAKLDDPKACQGQGRGFRVFGMDSNMISYVAKAYALLMGGMYKGGLDAKVPDQKKEKSAVDKATADKKGGKKDDYCALIGVGAETVGMAMQQFSAKTIQTPTKGGTDQKKILYKAARSHRDRAKTATIQAAGWGGAGACYVSMMSFGGAAVNSTNNILKTAAAGLLTVFYLKEREVQNRYADEVKKIADKLPQPGDCNPITEKDCYCALEEYQNDPQYCVPYLHQKKLSRGSILRVACTNDKLQADPNCQCLGTDSCLDKSLKKEFVASGMGSGFITSPIGKEVISLMRGEIKSGNLTSSQMGKNAGLNKFFRKYPKKRFPTVPVLGPSQERDADDLSRHFALPSEFSRLLVAAPKPPGLSASLSRLRGDPGKGVSPIVRRSKKVGQVWNFRGGKGLQGKKKNTSSISPGFDFKKYFAKRGQKKKAHPQGRIIKFDQRALNSAEVDKNREKNIFHIITRRYMLWGAQVVVQGP